MTTLADLKAEAVTVNVRTSYGKELTVRLRVPSFHKQRELTGVVPLPTPPATKWDKDSGKKVVNYADEDYLLQWAEATSERSYRLLVWALVEGGMAIDGDDLAEQVQTFRDSEPDAGIVEALLRFITDAVTGARVEARANSFRPVQLDENASATVDELVTGGLAGANGR